MTQQLLAFSRKQVLQPRVLDLNAVVSDAQKMLRRLIGEDIQFTSILASAPVLVNVDPGQIHQLLMNLVVNARDAMPQGGKLVIETATLTVAAGDAELASGGYAVLTVSDTGVGMDEVAKSHLFEPFFTTKEVGRGTGLGLATVFGIVKQSGGHIQVSSEPGQGTTFRIHLPRVQENAAAGEAVEPGAGRLRGSETILLVEDQEEVRRLVGKALRSYGYRTLEAGSADDALPLARSHPGPIHLLVTDLVMPGLSGRELAHRMREERPEMKVLYISGYAEGTVVLEGAAFLQKPFTAAALAQKVREVLGLPEEAAGAGGG